MKKVLAIAAAVALLLTPAVVMACSQHATYADQSVTNWINGGNGTNSIGRHYDVGQNGLDVDITSLFEVDGFQYDPHPDRHYHLIVKNPFTNEEIHLHTVWVQTPDGWDIESWLTTEGVNYISNFFDEHVNDDGTLDIDDATDRNVDLSTENG